MLLYHPPPSMEYAKSILCLRCNNLLQAARTLIFRGKSIGGVCRRESFKAAIRGFRTAKWASYSTKYKITKKTPDRKTNLKRKGSLVETDVLLYDALNEGTFASSRITPPLCSVISFFIGFLFSAFSSSAFTDHFAALYKALPFININKKKCEITFSVISFLMPIYCESDIKGQVQLFFFPLHSS